MKIYLLFYDDCDTWSTFYTPYEAFSTPQKRLKRKKQLMKATEDVGNADNDNPNYEPKNYVFDEQVITVDDPQPDKTNNHRFKYK